MNYPNGKKTLKSPSKVNNTANRGMSLEGDINQTNLDYLNNGIAVIHKKPTPITIVKVDYPMRSKAKITEAYFKLPSTTDYNGVYKGKYIDFEAKECASKTAFPFASIHIHQINHLENVIRQKAIAFIIIRMTHFSEDYLIDAKTFIDYYRGTKRKSLPYSWMKENGHLINFKYQRPCDYLEVVDEIYGVK